MPMAIWNQKKVYIGLWEFRHLIQRERDVYKRQESAIENETDIHSDTIVTEIVSKRQSVLDTDVGKELVEQIHDLEFLLEAYRSGRIAERL